MITAALEKVRESAEKLTTADKVALLDFLLLKIESEMTPEIDALWRKEIKQRARDMDSGKDPCVSLETVQSNIKRNFGFS